MDMFASRFKQEGGVMSKKTGADYRKFILQPGGSIVSFTLVVLKQILLVLPQGIQVSDPLEYKLKLRVLVSASISR